jgi:hypothetical protein
MGTRARVNVFDEHGAPEDKPLVSIYRQFDGYPEGLGQDVAEFAAPLEIVNGISNRRGVQANGMGCLAAQLIKHLKEGVGNVYIRDNGLESNGEEFVYNLREKGGVLHMEVRTGRMTAFGMPGDTEAEMKPLYDGPIKDYVAWLEAEKKRREAETEVE